MSFEVDEKVIQPCKGGACLGCDGPGLIPVLSLGNSPLANALLDAADADRAEVHEKRYPLDVALCPVCFLVQLTYVVPREQLFSDYPYFSSYSETAVTEAGKLAQELMQERKLGSDARVIEVASNDGYLLQFYREAGVEVLGIEPAANVAQVAERQREIPTLREFFGIDLATRLVAENQQADIIHANNVLAHVSDLRGFVEGFSVLLKPEGLLVVEVPYLVDLVDKSEFDTIYHEHLFYFSLTALSHIMAREGLQLVDVQRLSIHGGSLRVFAARADCERDRRVGGAERVKELLTEEATRGVTQIEYFSSFEAKLQRLKEDNLAMLRKLKEEGARIAAYGASAKGTTLMHYFGLDRSLIDFVVDRSDVKQGRFTPGTRLPIRSPKALLGERPDYVLLLTWNFAREILEQQRTFREEGGKFIVPLPKPSIV